MVYEIAKFSENIENKIKSIGERIKKERKSAGFTNQSGFARFMGYSIDSRQTVGNWEKGKYIPCMDDLLKMCNLFDCDLSYLLCEHKAKRRKVADVQKETGLSEEAINKLIHLNTNKGYEKVIDFLNMLIESEDFVLLADSCMDYLTAHTLWNKRKQDYKKETGIEMPEIPNDSMVKSIDIKGYIKSKKFDFLIENLSKEDKFSKRILKIFDDGLREGQCKETHENIEIGFSGF